MDRAFQFLIADFRYLGLDGHELMIPFFLDFFRNLAVHEGCRRAVFAGIGEDADIVEFRFLDEITEFLEFFFRFAREADDERRAQGQLAAVTAELLHEAAHIGFGIAAVHALQDGLGNVLERQVDVGTDFFFLDDEVHQFIRKVVGIEIEQADPADAVDLHQLAQQFRQQGMTGQVDAIARRVLGDEVDFLDAVGCQLLYFGDDGIDGPAVQLAPYMGNDAERAAVVAAFADFHIGTVLRRRPQAARILVVEMADIVHEAGFAPFLDRIDGFPDAVPRTGSQEGVDFRHFLHQIFFILLAQAARDDEYLAFPLRLVAGSLQYRINGFLLGFFNERTRIDDNDIRLGQVLCDLHMAVAEDAQHDFRINKVFGAA